MQYKTALVVGRFQPFHKGHLYLLKQALAMADEVVIAVGSANIQNDENPLSFEQREQMLGYVLEKEGWQQRVTKIVPSYDFPDDAQWLRSLLEQVGEFDVALGNNDWTNSVLAQTGMPVLTIPYLDRDIFQGTYIRELFRTQQNWKERVPHYLHTFLQNALQ